MDPDEMKRRSRGDSSDMSPLAIERRLRIVGELYRVWRTLRQARRIGPVEPHPRGTLEAPDAERPVPGHGGC
jgi:hypothetical protein